MDAESGKVLREAKTVQKGRKIRTRLKAGEIISTVDHGEIRQSLDNQQP